MRQTLALAALLSLALANGLAAQTTSSKVLPVPYYPQELNNWCWAASANMIMQYWYAQDQTAKVMSQCDQAIALWHNSNPGKPIPVSCPLPDPVPVDFNRGYAPFKVDNSYTVSISTTPLVWESVKYQIDNNMPFATEWSYQGVTGGRQINSNHWLIVVGYQTSQYATEPFISYCDPWAADSAIYRLIPFSEYTNPDLPALVNHPGLRFTQNIATYYNIRPRKP